jgi:hypothetical protein
MEETLAEMLRKKFQIQHKASVWKLCQHYNLLKEVSGPMQHLMYTVKKAFRFSRPQPGCHLPISPWAGIMNYSRKGEFGK